MEQKEITIETLVPADRSKVWDLYTSPEHIKNWNFASEDWQCPNVQNDLRAGGKYVARMEAKDQSFGFDFEAVYDEVVKGEMLRYTMGDGRQARTTFTDEGGSTRVTTTFDAENQHDIDMQRTGWQAILDNFKNYIAKQA